jgi:tetratricopeptide (TPR) repeat protein
VSTVPAEIAGLGSSAMKLRVSPGFDPLKAQVGPEEYFVLSRIDGNQTMRDILLSTGLSVERGIAILTKLRKIGALLLPGETTAPAPGAMPPTRARTDANATPARPLTPPRGVGIPPRAGSAPMPPPMSQRATGSVPAAQPRDQYDPPTIQRASAVVVDAPTSRLPPNLKDVTLDGPTLQRTPATRDAEINVVLPRATDAEKAALEEPAELSLNERLRILAMARLADGRDPWALLGVERNADAKILKRAYFKLSKEIHPDRFYGKQLGSFDKLLATVFEAVSRAYAKLTSPDKKGATGAHQAVGPEGGDQPQTPQDHAAQLFERACGLEVSGDALGAMKLFAAAVRIDSQTRYLRRAASCALAAEQPKTAVEYAKKAQTQAPDDPSSARLLAQAFRAAGKLTDAEEVLVMAMALKSENDVLTAELRNDLAETRRQIKASER